MNARLILVVILSLLLSCCAIRQSGLNFSNDEAIKFKMNPVFEFAGDSIILELYSNSSYTYRPYLNTIHGGYKLCDSTTGKFSIKKNKLKLIGLISEEYFRFPIKSMYNKSNKDSIIIEIRNFSDNSPCIDYQIGLFDKNDTLIDIKETNINGIISIERNNLKPLILVANIIGRYVSIEPKWGTHYTLTFFDCIPETLYGRVLKIQGDTLIPTNSLENNCFIRVK